jgi:AcrR family transcriptional regulator
MARAAPAQRRGLRDPVTAGEAALGRQAAKSRRTQQSIINAVIALINEGGYAAASSTQIAERAGVSWGAVQHHFGGKEEILEAVLARSHEAFVARLADPRHTRGTLAQRVARFVESAWRHYQGSEYMATLEILLATRAQRGAAARELRLDHGSHLVLWRSIFHDVALSDTRMQEAIYTVHCLLTGILVETVLEPGSFDARRYLRRLQRILLDMLAP